MILKWDLALNFQTLGPYLSREKIKEKSRGVHKYIQYWNEKVKTI